MYKLSVFFYLIFVTFVANAVSKDPTRPFGYHDSPSITIAENKLVLQSIVQGHGTRTAIINGVLLKQGENFGQYKLAKIDDNSVLLSDDFEKITLYVFQRSVLK